jgi:hypothetical protein
MWITDLLSIWSVPWTHSFVHFGREWSDHPEAIGIEELSSFGMVAMGNQIVVFGGIDKHGALSNKLFSCVVDQALCPTSSSAPCTVSSWTHQNITAGVTGVPPSPRSTPGVAVIADKLFVFSGGKNRIECVCRLTSSRILTIDFC